MSTTAVDRLLPVQSARDSGESATSGSSVASGSSKQQQQTGEKLSAQEKYQLMAQYDCEYSDEEIQYLFTTVQE